MATSIPASDSIAATSSKLRSCIVCRSRKVRCDKLSPCSNCRKAKIPCVIPSNDRPPRWARRLERNGNLREALSSPKSTHDADSGLNPVIERLHNLENLVKELRGQLEQANASATLHKGESTSRVDSIRNNDTYLPIDATSAAVRTSEAQNEFGRLVVQDVNHSRYISSGFWARMNDEIEGLQTDAYGDIDYGSNLSSGDEGTPEEALTTLDTEPIPSDRHIPAITKMIRNLRAKRDTSLTPANEALMFSIYYATVISMEDDEILTNFGCIKSELSSKYRLGLEHCLAKADFLGEPDIILVQALLIFLFLDRRHDSPRYVWMMTGLVIRMAQALGLHRDGSHFPNLTPYEVETRRRVWWTVCLLDLRSSEDQGTELSTVSGSVDTKMPLNINEMELRPEAKDMPSERQGVTDMTLTVVSAEMCDIMRRLMITATAVAPSTTEDQSRLLQDLYDVLDRRFLQYSDGTKNIASWCLATLARMVVSKMTLIIHLPILFSSPDDNHTEEIRTKLLISAIEVAEYNHALNSKRECRHWNWLFQTCTHWHAIVYLLVEISQRQWSPIVERAWVALHSKWLIPKQIANQSGKDKNSRIWVPLRKLITKTRRHRLAELRRLRGESWSATQLEIEDNCIPLPASPVPFHDGKSNDSFRDRWCKLIAMPQEPGNQTQSGVIQESVSINRHTLGDLQQVINPERTCKERDLWSIPIIDTMNVPCQDLSSMNSNQAKNSHDQPELDQPLAPTNNTINALPSDWSYSQTIDPNTILPPWTDPDTATDLFADGTINMDLDADMDVNWYEWIEVAQVMEF